MLGTDITNFFFEQKRKKRFQQRRLRKFYDPAAAGERKDGITLYLREQQQLEGDATSIVGGAGGGAPSVVSVLRDRRISVAGSVLGGHKTSRIDAPGIRLPPIPRGRPSFVAATAPTEEALALTETRSIVGNEKKLTFLQEAEAAAAAARSGRLLSRGEEREKGLARIKPPRAVAWSLKEAQFASIGILSKLSRVFLALKEEEVAEVTIPKDLVGAFLQSHGELVSDTVVERREWQTDCYLDDFALNAEPFLTGVPDQEGAERSSGALVKYQQHSKRQGAQYLREKLHRLQQEGEKQQQQQQQQQQQEKQKQQQQQQKKKKVEKHVRMSKEVKMANTSIPERPHTARSITSNFSFRSEPSEDDGRESTFTTDYDRLPPELRPSLLNFRRESLMPKLKKKRQQQQGPQTRLERRRSQVERASEEAMAAKKTPRKETPGATRTLKRLTSASHTKKGASKRPGTAKSRQALEEEWDDKSLQHALVLGPKTTINFSVNEDNDWLHMPSDAADPEAHTLRMWDKKLKELQRKREESLYMERNRGADKPMVVKFYSEPHLRSLRSKHQRSATVPLPALLSKLPPSIGNFSSPAANEALMIGEGAKVFVLTLPDGSGDCNYISGRQAISRCRCDKDGPLHGSRGLYTFVFDDVEHSQLLAFFTPMGKACCYYRNGAIHMLSDRKGGCLYSEDGVVTRKWEWPHQKLSLAVAVSIYLNVHISLRCTNLSNMDLRISTRGHSHKFPVGPSLQDLESTQHGRYGSTEELIKGNIQSTCLLFSKAAKSHTLKHPRALPGTSVMETKKTTRKASSLKLSESSDDPQSNLNENGEEYTLHLNLFKNSVQGIVSKWLKDYCKALGIQDPAHLSRPTSTIADAMLRPESRSRHAQRGVSPRGRLVKSSMDYITDAPPPSSPYQLRRTRSLTHPFNVSRPSSRPITPFKLPGQQMGDEGGDLIHRTNTPQTPFPLMRPTTPLDYAQTPEELHNKPFRTGKAKPVTQSAIKTSAIGCPIALHDVLWKKLDSMPSCKCDKRRVPYIHDLEYDVFLLSHVPKDQLIIICVTSTLKEDSCACEPMVNKIYTNQNRMRYSPCRQGSHDPFRLIKYDIACARRDMRNTGHPEQDRPLLVARHNATPGMFLMYLSGKLVHADYMFNGYSNSKKDFMKQVGDCIKQGKSGRFMPYDFKFARHSGNKVLGSHAWAYPVSGFMHDLVPFSPPQSGSQTASTSPLRRGSTPTPDVARQQPPQQLTRQQSDRETESSTTLSQLTLSCNTSTLKVSQTTMLS